MDAVKPKLLLWDIDGTLICSGGAGERALMLSLRHGFGMEGSLEAIDYRGRTDVWIGKRILEHFGVPQTPENLRQYLDGYLHYLQEELPRSPGKTHVGILSILNEAKRRPDLHQGLLTGNLVQGARIKLEHFDVWEFFEFGAFADDSDIRDHLGPVAKARAQDQTGIEFVPENIFIVGDTPHDVSCARVIGAHCIAVATGGYSLDELQACDPLAVLADFSDPAAFFRVVDQSGIRS